MSPVKVLCVDDEPHLIEGLAVNLRRKYEVTPALSGAEGLKTLQEKGPFAIVLLDMRMPGMDGATFLARVRQAAPDTIRMLLTGHADVQAAIAAVNQGRIFRFLTKPCPPDELRQVFGAAAEQHRLVTAERVLLEQTLHGSIKTLVDALSLTNPFSFGRAMRVKQHVSDLAEKLGLRERWHVEVAAMLSQLGCITLPTETVENLYYGRSLSEPEQKMVSRLSVVTEQLLANIPRLEIVRGILATYVKPYRRGGAIQGGSEKQLIERGAQMLRIAIDYDAIEAQGNPMALPLDTMRGRADCYDPLILQAFAAIRGGNVVQDEIRELPVSAIREGMVFAEDVKMSSGALLAARGYEVMASFVERAWNFRAGYIKEPIRVIVRGAGPARVSAARRRT
jgi:response regulator RpfG family c-di-GMP phosphodiesterase